MNLNRLMMLALAGFGALCSPVLAGIIDQSWQGSLGSDWLWYLLNWLLGGMA